MNIDKLLRPDRIAVVGASEREGFGGDTCRNIIQYMDESRYYFVNPKYDSIFGYPVWKSLSEIKDPIDLVIICTPMKTVEAILREAADIGVKGAVVYASGYKETGTKEGKQAEESLKRLCKELDIALMGPNCAGFVNYIDSCFGFAFISDVRDRKGSVGVVSQSGQLVLSMMDRPHTSFSYLISAGNAGVVQVEDYLSFLVDDSDTKVIATYLEGVKSPERFIDVLEKAALKRKPVVILKSGRSLKGQALAASHTGSMSGSDKTYDVLFEKYGVIRVDDLEELLSTSMALATLPAYPRGQGLGAISLSGGETGICADLGEMTGLLYPDFSPTTLEELDHLLPTYATPNNPLDSTATLSYDTEAFAKLLEVMMKDEKIDMVAVGYSLLQEIADPAIHYMAAAMDLASKEPWYKPTVMVPFIENTRNAEYYSKLRDIGVPVLPTTLYAFKVIKNILTFSAYRPEDHAFLSDFHMQEASEVPEGSGALTETESKEVIRSFGIKTGEFRVVNSRKEAAEAFRVMGVEKVVAKVDSPDILHKSDAGCVILSLTNEEEVAEAYDRIIENARHYNPEARVRGVQIGEMLPQGLEMIVGVNNDPDFGPVILCGLGGVFVEVFKDVSLALAPINEKEARKMLESLKAYKLLNGYRGTEKVDIESIIQILMKVSQLALTQRETLKELDINPVMVYGEGAVAVDALYIRK